MLRRMIATMTRLLIGSSNDQPVRRMTKPATTTPAETAASAAMWRKAPRILRSRFRPPANIQAVTPLTMTPAAATQIIVRPTTGAGSRNAADRFRGDRADADEQKNGVEKRGEDGGAAQAVGEALGRAAALEIGRRPSDQQSHHVAEIVAGIGEERERMAEQSEDHFRDDEAGVEQHADREGASEIDLLVVRMTHRFMVDGFRPMTIATRARAISCLSSDRRSAGDLAIAAGSFCHTRICNGKVLAVNRLASAACSG